MNPIQFFTLSLTALLVFGTAGNAFANPFGREVNHRQHNEYHRIHEGVENGSLTRSEANRLREKQRRINHAERVARADGHIGSREAARLDRLQDRQNHAIYNQKHDGQIRY